MLYETTGRGPNRFPTWFLSGLLILCLCGPAWAGRFVNLVETATFPRSEGEVVQATAFSTCSKHSAHSDVLEFQAGVEYGLLTRFQIGFAFPSVAINWADDTKSTQVGGTAFWGLYNFVDPAAKGWGLTGAILVAEDAENRAGEFALLAEKQMGPWVVVYNGVAGRSWARIREFGSTDSMAHSLGVSCQVSNSIFLGLEGDQHLTHGDGWESSGRYLGPNLSVDTGRLWMTAAAQFAVDPGEFIPNQLFQAQIGLPF